jgi:hypothetical protein
MVLGRVDLVMGNEFLQIGHQQKNCDANYNINPWNLQFRPGLFGNPDAFGVRAKIDNIHTHYLLDQKASSFWNGTIALSRVSKWLRN